MIRVHWFGKFKTPSGAEQRHNLMFDGDFLDEIHQQIRDHVQRFTDNDYVLVENEITKIEHITK